MSENGYRYLWEEEKILIVNLVMLIKVLIYMVVDIGEFYCFRDK